MKKIVIFGLGETAHLAYEYFTHDPDYSDYEVVGFCADAEYIKESQFLNLPVIAMDDVVKYFPPNEYYAFASASSGQLNRVREKLFTKAKNLNYKLVSYVSSRAFVWHNVEIGENCFILEDNTLQPFTKIKDNVILWSGNHIGHQTVIESHSFISSHCVISGYCSIGKYCFMGVNASVADNIKIAKDNFIGFACAIGKNTEENGFYIGNPATQKSVPAKRFCKVKD